jgi:predicted RNase H-like HicB family nuclease
MQYQVFVQSHTVNHFVASVVGIPNLSVEGTTEAEAIAKVKTALENQLMTGKFVTVEVDTPSSENDPWIKHMGIFADDPTFDDFLAEIQAYRSQADAQGLKND